MLAAAIEGLYSVFGRYPRRSTIDGCPCCVRAEAQAALNKPLRKLACEDLSHFAFKAMTTWGDDRDYRHFLPRILDLAATQAGRSWPGFDLEIQLGKLERAGWNRWKEPERIALQAYFRALFVAAITDAPKTGLFPAEVLLVAAQILPEPQQLLDVWATSTSPSATLRLAEFVDEEWSDQQHTGRLLRRWNTSPLQSHLVRWLRAPERRQHLEAYFAEHLDEPQADLIAVAVDQLGTLAAAPDPLGLG